ncbi:Fusaric acid resistance protein-like-domain-containing protein [Lipomyces kononenkoae]|uniref:Fusaric acid resistance protein-like-domain-containing protein n=1 Tax=Lipomyces kononenkoae TaxID=34357 RepID=A0ACC3TAQ6_LIPKO
MANALQSSSSAPDSPDGLSDGTGSAMMTISGGVSPRSSPSTTDRKAGDMANRPQSVAQDTESSSSTERPRYGTERTYSLIVPETGERVRRHITLSPFDSIGEASSRDRLVADYDLDNDQAAEESTALLINGNGAETRALAPKTTFISRWISRRYAIFKRRIKRLVQAIRIIRWINDHIFFHEFTRPLKCSLTYFLASLTVFSSTISSLLGTGDSKHLTATVTVYFHPSRTIGSMIEALAFAELALVYSTLLSYCSMVTAAGFRKLDLLWVGHAIVLVVFCAGGLGSIALMKHKIGKQTFNTACSVASTAFTRILVREGSVQEGKVSFSNILQVGLLVNIGVFVSATVCFLVFPVTAISRLKKTCKDLVGTYTHILVIITRSFLSGSWASKTEIEELFNVAGSLISSLDTSIKEAKYEHYICGTETEYFLQMRLVKSIESITQHLGGLRSSWQMQWDLTNLQEGHTRSSCGELFDIFVYYLEPPMKSLTFTVKGILEGLPFNDQNFGTYDVRLNSQFAPSLNMALDLFSSARMKALKEIYAQEIFAQQENRAELAIHLEKVASTCGQFSQGLVDLAREILSIIHLLKEYEDYVSSGRPRSWWWLVFWKPNPKNLQTASTGLEEEDVTVPSNLAHLFNDDNIGAKNQKDIARDPWRLKMWRAFRMFRRNDVRFGIKVGVGALLFTLPAYIPQTRDIFSHYRGEWGLVTFVLMTNMSIGGTTSTVLYRIFGTVIGCYSAWLVWYIFPSNRVALALTGLFIAFPCFCIILGWKSNGAFGRFVLLAFNLTALYSYSLSQNDVDRDDDNEDEGGVQPVVGEIAFHRLVSVSCGVLWSLVITVYIWPMSARATLKRKLSILWIRMGLLWKNDPLNSLTVRGEPSKPYVSIHDEQKLQKSLLNMRSLMVAAENEFRLKGPFPKNHYAAIMNTTQEILDVYHNMNSMIMKDLYASERESRMIAYTIDERKELSNRIFLLFYLIAAALRLNLPLPYDLPNTVHARDRMIVKVNEYRMKQLSEDAGTEDDFVLFYAFILATMSINDGLLHIIASLQEIYGSVEEETLSI